MSGDAPRAGGMVRGRRLVRSTQAVCGLLGLALAAGLCGPAQGAEGRAYRPLPARVGAVVSPPADLRKAAQDLHAAAIAEDAPAVFALLARRMTLVTSGLTPGARRHQATAGPWPGAEAALDAIGAAVMEGDLPPGGADPMAARRAAFALMAAATEAPEWGRDPLVGDAACTYRGVRWSATAGAKIDGGARGLHVPAATPVHADAQTTAVIGKLKPGRIYLQADMDGLPDGWRGVRLPSGRVGAVRESDIRDPAVSGLCFRRGADGRWRVIAVAAALL